MSKTWLVRLCLLAPVVLVAVSGLHCMKLVEKCEQDFVFGDSTGNFEIPAQGYVYFKATVTPEMLELKNHPKAYLYLNALVVSAANNFKITAYFMSENNLLAYGQNLPFEYLAADSSLYWAARGLYVASPGDYYGVLASRADPLPRRVNVEFTIQHWALVPK